MPLKTQSHTQKVRSKMALHKYNGWTIHSTGGFIMIKHFIASKQTFDNKILHHWACKLKDCKELCDKRDRGEEINRLFLEPLYQ